MKPTIQCHSPFSFVFHRYNFCLLSTLFHQIFISISISLRVPFLFIGKIRALGFQNLYLFIFKKLILPNYKQKQHELEGCKSPTPNPGPLIEGSTSNESWSPFSIDFSSNRTESQFYSRYKLIKDEYPSPPLPSPRIVKMNIQRTNCIFFWFCPK